MPRKGQRGDTPALRKAREARHRKSKVARDDQIWRIIRSDLSTCKCGLRKGMTLEELRPLGAGCRAGSGRRPGWVCQVLDRYRRLLEGRRWNVSQEDE